MSTTPPSFPLQPVEQVQAQQTPAYAPASVYETPAPANTTVAYTNTYALVAVILAFMVPLAGIIFGHMGLNQIKRTGDTGRGLALTAVIYGYCVLASALVFAVLYIGFIAVMLGSLASIGTY